MCREPSDGLRRHLATVVAVLAVAAIAATQVLAQDAKPAPATGDDVVGTAAVGNADTVDGRHAVGARASIAARAGRLVATNRAGYLPDDIIVKARDADRLDGIDSRAFARRSLLASDAGAVNEADNPIHWRQLRGVPPDIADGADEPSHFWSWWEAQPLQPAGMRWHGIADVHTRYRVEWRVVPASGGTYLAVPRVAIERQPNGLLTHWVLVESDGTSASATAYTIEAAATWEPGGDILLARVPQPREVPARGGPRGR
jgi:hypothetical protein